MSDNFYFAFEDRYRGPRELIQSRLQVYLPFVRPLLDLDGGAWAVDLGCGRGEWLELLASLGFDATGIDLDPGMLAACRQLGLKAERGDALDFIAALPDASLGLVSAFHFVEHIPFPCLQDLVAHALRVLVPGGLLIMETPNPENILVATREFYLDPTHRRPIPPALLAFLAEHSGFARHKILRLQESKALADPATALTLQDVLEGASPDYAVVAQKTATTALDPPFAVEYGLDLDTLTRRYQSQLAERIQQVQTQAAHAAAQAGQALTRGADLEAALRHEQAQLAELVREAETQAGRALARAEQAEAQTEQALARAEQAEAQAEQALARAEQAEAQAAQAEDHARQAAIQAQYAKLASTELSSRLQASHARRPLAQALRLARQIIKGDFSVAWHTSVKTKQTLRPLLAASIHRLLSRPALGHPLSTLLKTCFPWLHRRLRRVALNTGVVVVDGQGKLHVATPGAPDPDPGLDESALLPTLTPEARRIYLALKTKTDNNP
ncbi:O-antigen chain-terminating methyltransferase [Methylomagnum ishizawai]|uniref:O-antigen chain-terminating methyltransferase n=1 Tax=Methylomagnum ishizawai TaxID=1760988 RepID=A0A1Y6D3H2_9GAMM|nr:class I SAM-dependent methyltransferase [Methylomagnum ishizawai]SMF94944.1 O-antigen chain-terminating methyltransferase [Methylomagnum ishizawai]